MIREKFLFWFNAIFYIIFGCVMMFKPDLALETIIITFWIESILSWIAWVVLTIEDKEFEERWILAGLSIFQILVWVLLAFFPQSGELIIKIFIVLVWILLIIRWILLLIDSSRIKKLKFNNRYWVLIAGLWLILLWLFLAMNSLLTIFIINGVIGLWMFVLGISMIVWVVKLRKALK